MRLSPDGGDDELVVCLRAAGGGYDWYHIAGQPRTQVDLSAAPYRVRAEATPTTDWAATIQGAIDTWSAKGGADLIVPGDGATQHVGIGTAGLKLKSGIRLVGKGVQGSRLSYIGTAGDTAILLHAGEGSQTYTLERAGISNLILDGRSQNVTALSIRSDTPTNPAFVTRQLVFENYVIQSAFRGIAWGDWYTGRTEQSDFCTFRNGVIQNTNGGTANTNSGAIKFNANNGGDLSLFDRLVIITGAPVDGTVIELARSGFLTMMHVAGGGDGTETRDFISIASLSNRLKLFFCQSEKHKAFLRHTGNNYLDPVELHGCSIDDPVFVTASGVILSYGSKIKHTVHLSGAGAVWQGYGDIINSTTGGRFVKNPSAVFRNSSWKKASTFDQYHAGETLAAVMPTALPGKRDDVVVVTGRRAAVWQASTAYSTAVEESWAPSTAYALNDLVTPTFGNGKRYICTVSGTSAATEPIIWPIFSTTKDVTDGTVTWRLDGAASASVSATIYREPTVANGHVYKVVTAGTSGAGEPAFPTTAGATVADNTVVWQETGPTPTIRGDFLTVDSSGNTHLSGDVELDGALNHDGATVGFYGVTPVAQSAAYTPTNVTPDRSYDADTVLLAEMADVLGTLIADLQATGIIG